MLLFAAAFVLSQPPAQGDSIQPELFQPGVTLRVFQIDADLKAIPRLKEGQSPNVDELRPTIDWRTPDFILPKGKGSIYTRATALLVTATEGDYAFRVTSDDGSRVTINSQVVINHDGTHSATAKVGEPVHLAAGRHRLLVEHFDHAGDRRLTLEWQPPGVTGFSVVPTENLLTEIDNAAGGGARPETAVRCATPGRRCARHHRSPEFHGRHDQGRGLRSDGRLPGLCLRRPSHRGDIQPASARRSQTAGHRVKDAGQAVRASPVSWETRPR